ncbi:hypothetical protein K440DRAFT_78527 [Wilcoxina mikolae CBS 423.85]|nr:hypothetical protein K440DRAFT_78527 [Wilcoxina mikolae CBS 423.85]
MASVSSLDKDLARLRRSKYTPEAANAVSSWIASILSETLPRGDLMDILKDGTILCRLANHLGGKQIRFKTSAMPFVQMENISHFLSTITSPPVSLPPHDRFLTVDLYEKKDPAQVLQCLGAFSRVAHNINPKAFPDTVGGLKSATTTTTGPPPTGPKPEKKVAVSAWTKREEEGVTAPAWNVVQYGYMGGASQGNQGIMFGGRRQITASPVMTQPGEGRRATSTPASVMQAEKERRGKEAGEKEKEREKERERMKNFNGSIVRRRLRLLGGERRNSNASNSRLRLRLLGGGKKSFNASNSRRRYRRLRGGKRSF